MAGVLLIGMLWLVLMSISEFEEQPVPLEYFHGASKVEERLSHDRWNLEKVNGVYWARNAENFLDRQLVTGYFKEVGVEIVEEQDNSKETSVEGRMEGLKLSARWFELKEEHHLKITAKGETVAEVKETIKQIGKPVEAKTSATDTTVSLQGSWNPGKNSSNWLETAQQDFEGSLGGNIIHKKTTNNSLNLSGYTPEIPAAVTSEEDKINLNLLIKEAPSGEYRFKLGIPFEADYQVY